MPLTKKNYKRVTSRKSVRRRPTRKLYRKRTMRPQSIIKTGFPRQTMVKLKYVEGITLDAGAGTIATHSFRCNSLFDPNQTGVGHQPMNFDQWSLLYNHYLVVGSICYATICNNVSATNEGIIAGIMLDDDGTIPSSSENLMEQGLVKYRIMNTHLGAGSGSGHTIKRGFSCKKFFNVSNPTDATNRLGASVLANPTEVACFNIFLGPTPGSVVDHSSHRVIVTIIYTAIFSEPKEQNQS